MGPKIHEAFKTRMKASLTNEYQEFEDSLLEESPISLRLNPNKQISQYDNHEKVPWCEEGVYLKERPHFYKDPLIFAGAYYVQEASSMFLSEALKQSLNLNDDLKVLDLCAAPGGKSTLMSSLISEDSLLVSNELVGKRASVLSENMVRWGNLNNIVTNNNVGDINKLKNYFDVIVVDAPCSGEGMFRKDPKIARQWSPQFVINCSITQKQILEEVMDSLKPGGVLIYSTCTYSPNENEENIEWLLNKYYLENIKLEVPKDWNITEEEIVISDAEHPKAYGYRFFLHKTKGEGFFLASFRKSELASGKGKIKLPKKKKPIERLPKKYHPILDKWLKNSVTREFIIIEEEVFAVPLKFMKDIMLLNSLLTLKHIGIKMGKFKNNKLIPSHDLAVSNIISSEIDFLEVNWEEAIKYLKREELKIGQSQQKGWVLIRYQGINLGWVKILPNRINNYYPIELRLKKEF